ncbi:hypothetical protein ACEU6E_09295 [Halorutilales archaeon Cl-col2-1]|nr:hypothetical protein [Halobacteria archaeon]
MADKIACVKYTSLLEELEVEQEDLDHILDSLLNQGFVTTVKLDGEMGYCLTQHGAEYTEDWFRSLDIDIGVEEVTLEHLVEMLESTAPPDRQS